jgi:RHS repeat-associated protein
VLEPPYSTTGRKPWVPAFPGGDPLEIPIDPNGNLTSKTEGTDTWTYSWNAENQLTKVEKNGAEVARFAYDPLGRRVEKVASGVTTGYTYDDDNILRESRGSSTVKYIHGGETDKPLAVDDAAALTYFHADGLGSIAKMTNGAGAVSLVRQYDAWGNLELGVSEPSYSFTGREWDPETGLYYYRARYYDPEASRFVSEDPIGLAAGINFYVYVENSPTLLVDPSGLQAGRPWPPMPMSCGQAMNNAWTLFRQVKESKVPDKVGHCLAHCWVTKSCGPGASHTFDRPREAWDAAKGVMGKAAKKAGLPPPFDPNNKWQEGDINANEHGRSCPKEMSCEERCWFAQDMFGPDR